MLSDVVEKSGWNDWHGRWDEYSIMEAFPEMEEWKKIRCLLYFWCVAMWIKFLKELVGIPLRLAFRPSHLPKRMGKGGQNIYITGATWMGKSELMKRLAYMYMNIPWISLVIIDPHGDLSKEIMSLRITRREKDRLIYLDPFLSKNSTRVINPFEIYDRDENGIGLFTQELVGVFKELLPSHLTLQMEAILTPCIATLLRSATGSLSELQRFMDDARNHDLLVQGSRSPNPNHATFFQQAFRKPEYRVTKQSIYTRIQSLLNHMAFHRLTDGKSTVNLRQCVDKGKIILLNLSQGRMWAEMSSTVGKFIIAQLTGIAMRRSDKPIFLRTPTYLLVDEFHNYMTGSISKILAETRKYGLHLVASHQSLSQLSSKWLKDSMLGNSHVKLVGGNSPTTLSTLAKEMGIPLAQLQSINKFEFMAQSGNGKPIRMRTNRHLAFRFYQMDKPERQKLRKYILESGQYVYIKKEQKIEIVSEDVFDSPTPRFRF
jgi:hypothetical protein